MVAKLRAGEVPAGARPCLAAFTLPELAAMSDGLELTFARTDTPLTPVFRTALGTDFDDLPKGLRDLHGVLADRRWSGIGRVERGEGLAARAICFAVGFPPAAEDVPVTVTMERRGDAEIWVRDFGGRRFRSHLRSAGAPGKGEVTERFGPLTFRIGLKVVDGRLTYPVLAGRLGPVPLPRWLLPRSETVEAADGAGVKFDVDVSLPRVGRLVRYRGRLVPSEA
ncbi:DUF4166 domain-containing protein [Jannaschia marina]|uniref:DUF4166 domain-containing protein n=1 Tax=Jannaschia marina TaxID=2741674 RepID=UPI0015CB42DF|nr:DUF4166 domain-containing protein [Jannaschia marina]